MIFIPSTSCDSTNSRSNRSINTSRFPGCSVYCRSSTIGQQVCSGFALPIFSIPKKRDSFPPNEACARQKRRTFVATSAIFMDFESMKVFISYSGPDEKWADLLRTALSKYDVEAWDPASQIAPGENWGLKYGKAIENADAVVVLVSPDSVK